MEIVNWCTNTFGIDALHHQSGQWTWGKDGVHGKFVYHIYGDDYRMWFALTWSDCIEEIPTSKTKISWHY